MLKSQFDKEFESIKRQAKIGMIISLISGTCFSGIAIWVIYKVMQHLQII